MNLQRYFERIGYGGSVEPSVATLVSLHRHHVHAVPFENLDVQLGKPLSTRIDEAFEKIVLRNRGGWCYEQNGLFGWALAELGFDVTRISAAVMREQRGAVSSASHLCLVVRCPDEDTRYLADVGFGGSLVTPIPLKQARYSQPPFGLGLTRLGNGTWQFWEDAGDGRFTFDFAEDPADERAIDARCEYLQRDPSSSFVLNLVAQRRDGDEHRTLRGRVLTVATPGSVSSERIDSPAALVAVLADRFCLHVPEVAALWPKICERHEQVF